MSRVGWLSVIVVAALALTLRVLGQDVVGAHSSKSKYALLIGVSRYEKSRLDSLDGPENDVELMTDVLEHSFGVPAKNITVLINDEATHTRIRGAFEDLARKIKGGDFVYVHYSGHGSTTPDSLDRRGEDQTWVSYGARSGASGLDDFDVLDKELALWIQPIYARTDDVVFVSDSCHSATVSKGERKSVRAARRDARQHPLVQTVTRIPPPKTGIRIGAARDAESAFEIDPLSGQDCADSKRCNGAFTWYWAQQLRRARPDETWMEVFDRTSALVTTQPATSQRPQIEGLANRRVFGGEFKPLVNTLTVLEANDGEIKLQGGAASSVTRGSVYLLHRGPGEKEDDAPELEITQVEATTSSARVRRGTFHANDQVAESLHVYSFPPIRLYVGGDFEQGEDAALIRDIRRFLESLPGFKLVSQRADADWWVYVVRSQMAADDAPTEARLPESKPGAPPVAWVVSRDGMLAHPKLRIAFADAARGKETLASNLRTFVWSREVKHLGGRGNTLPISLTIDVTHANGSVGSSFGLADLPRVLDFSDRLSFVLKNKDSRRSLYAYVAAIGPDSAIRLIQPLETDNEDEARLNPGETLPVGQSYRLDEPGLESLLLIATEDPIRPSALLQAGFSDKGGPPQRSELGLLLAAKSRSKGSVDAPVQVWGAIAADIEVAAEHYTAGVFLEPRERIAIPDGAEVRRLSEKGLRLTREEEGFRPLPYDDIVRYCTVAYGHLIKKTECDGTEPAEFLAGVSEKRGAEILDTDMMSARWSVQRLTQVQLTDSQFAALSDFVFNVGVGNFSRSTLLRAINGASFDAVPAQLARWTMVNGKEVRALARRRQREIDLFFEGGAKPRGAPPAGEDVTPIDIRTGEMQGAVARP